MAKKKFNVTSTLGKNKPQEPTLAPKIPLKKNEKNFEEVKDRVEELHSESTPVLEKTPSKDTIKKAENVSKSAPRSRTRKKAVEESSKPEKLVRLTIDTPAEMHTQLKIKAVLSGISMRDYILRLLEKELKKG